MVEEVPTPTLPTLPRPAPIQLVRVEWVVVQTEDGSVFALTPEQYENLSLNTAEILRYVREARSQLDYYRQETTDGR